jgi:hypothetical protein
MRTTRRSPTARQWRLVLISLAAAIALGLPGAASASPPQERKGTVVAQYFVSADQLRAAGMLVDKADPDPGIQPQWGCVFDCWYLRKVVYTGQTNVFRTQAKGSPGPMTLTLSTTLTVSNSFTATVGVKAAVVSAGVGFSVTWSASQTYSASVSVPSGACRIIKAYDTFNNYRFEVWDQNFIGDPFKVGSGTAKRFIGVWYQVVTC